MYEPYPPPQSGYYPPPQGGPYGPPQSAPYPPPQQAPHPPPVSPPWTAQWDGQSSRFYFVNQQTGERTWNYPGSGYAQQQGSYGPPQGGYGYDQGGYSNRGAYDQNSYDPTRGAGQEQKSGSNAWKYAAAGAAGIAGGALLMHESDRIGDAWDSGKENISEGFDEFGNAISDFPENAANFAGSAVGGVENFGESVVDGVTEFPENAAHWTGEKVEGVTDTWDGAVEGVQEFGDNMGDAYDEGREDARYDDDD